MIQLELSLFGGFAASVNSESITQFRTDKMWALLAYLALNGERPFRRESLATLLWSEWPDDAARRNLRQTLHRLRQLLDELAPGLGDDLLTMTRQTVQLNGTTVSLDVAQPIVLLAKGELLLSLEWPSEAEPFITEGMLLAKESNSSDLISWGQKLAGEATG